MSAGLPVGLAVTGLVAMLLLEGCTSTSQVRARAPAPLPLPPGAMYTVASGDTLFGIASRYGLDLWRVAAWNRIGPPYVIYPGQRLRLAAQDPEDPVRGHTGEKTGTSSHARAAAGVAAVPGAVTGPSLEVSAAPERLARPPPRSSPSVGDRPLAWNWPARGRIVRYFAEDGSKGVDIRGEPGAPVRAAAPGRVVYSGSGLVGYGKLIIVKHNNTYLSAYGHNDRVLVKEGDPVAGGQRIASMGRDGAQGASLHFEIRRHGKPVDPLGYLPKPSPPQEDSDA